MKVLGLGKRKTPGFHRGKDSTVEGLVSLELAYVIIKNL